MNDSNRSQSKLQDRLMGHVRDLTGIGIRFAGTAGEREAAERIESALRSLGLEVQRQEFPCLSFDFDLCELEGRENGRWAKIPAYPAAHSPSTPSDGIQADLMPIEKIPEDGCWQESPASRAAVVYSSELFDFARFGSLMQADPAAVLVVDDRLPFDWTVAVGFPRAWVDRIRCPVVNVPYAAAWEMTRNGVDRIRVRLQTKVEKAVSQNVIADLPGAGSNELTIVSAHHDSVLNNPGADDNCSGVAVMLELARHFSRNPPYSGLRFISFGTEEQLSEGARHYLLHEPDLSRIRFALNNDAMGGWMGRTEIYCTGSEKLRDFVEKVCRETGFPGHPTIELSPFSDHFPLNLAGIPSAWYYRKTFAAARHFHHSRKETDEVVSPAVLARTTLHQVALLEKLTAAGEPPFPSVVPAEQRKRLSKMAMEWCGLRKKDLPNGKITKI